MNQPQAPQIPEPTIRRLPWYLAYVEQLEQSGVTSVSSTQISKALNVDSSRIAKDLSFLNLKGKTRIGYEVEALKSALTDFLGFKVSHRACVLGAGSLGKALIRDTGLHNYGLDIVAAFDNDPRMIGRVIDDVEVYDIARLEEVMTHTPASIGILTVPADKAQQTAERAIEAGIRAFWNFTPTRINVPEGVVMESTLLYANLALIFNRLK